MSNLKNIISPIEGFQYSVNIAYDIYDDKKIKSFIPSISSLQIIEDILASTNNKSNDRARILTGSYGKGKSHLILYILALLAGRDSSLFSTAIEKSKVVNPNLAKNIEAYLSSKKKLLPVIVNTNSLNIKTSLLQSLSIALKQAELEKVMPTTFFDAAINKILSWKKSFPDTYVNFEKSIGESCSKFINELKDFNQSSYDLFTKIYPTLTAGSEFNPLISEDIIEVYDSVITAIKPFGYSGIFVVYDEFGKFLEGSVDKSSAMDIKMIQDFAEKCNRSGDKQLHLMLISHKSIDNYIGRLSKTKVDAWKAVSNRFKSIYVNSSETEIFDIVSTVINKNKTLFKDFVKEHKNNFIDLENVVNKDHAFSSIDKSHLDALAYNCYPLHPYTLLMLPKISELVAQNERTIFTFLSSSERFSVSYFIRNNESDFPIIEPDYIYDYFEKLFRGEPYGSDIKKQWQTTTNALSKLKEYDNILAEKIVKTLALIYSINDFELIPPSWDIITDIYSVNYSWPEIESAKEILKSAHLLIELLYKPYVRITEGSRHDVLGMIQEESYKIEKRIDFKQVFNDNCSIKYFYPVQYNDDNELVRYFDFKFIDVNDLGSIKSSNADGTVFAILTKTQDDIDEAINKVKSLHNNRAVFIIPKGYYASDSFSISFQAIQNLKNLYKDKEFELIEELDFLLEDRQNVLTSFIENTYIRFEQQNAYVYYNGERRLVSRKAQFTQLLSEIMNNVYYRTPRIVNDLINRNNISSTIKNARNKVLSALLSGNLKKDLGLFGNGPEQNILRSTLIIPGVFINSEEPSIELECSDERIRNVINEIKNHIIQSTLNNEHNLGELYDVLISPEYGYGIKKGIIPIYLAVVIANYKDRIVIKRKTKELSISDSLLCDIEHSPSDYSIILEKLDEGKDIYIANLEDLFSQYVNSSDKINGSFMYIVKSMRRWYLQLTKYEATTNYSCNIDGQLVELSKETLKFRNALSNPEINPYEFLFEQLPNIFKCMDYNKLLKKIRSAFDDINNSYRNIRIKLIKECIEVLDNKEHQSLSSSLANFYDDLKSSTKEHLFSGKVNMFLTNAKQPISDDMKLIENVARSLFNLRMSDFTDDIMSCFVNEFKMAISEIKTYDNKLDNTSATGYKIMFNDDDGNEVTRQFDSTDYTKQGQLLYNDITSTLDDFGDALSSDEKRQVLFRILKELI